MENEIKEFFGVQDDGKSKESEKNDLNNDGKRSVAEDIEKNVKMSADKIFGKKGGSGEDTESSGDNTSGDDTSGENTSGDNNEKPVSEKKEEEPKDEPKDKPKDEPKDEPEPPVDDEPEP